MRSVKFKIIVFVIGFFVFCQLFVSEVLAQRTMRRHAVARKGHRAKIVQRPRVGVMRTYPRGRVVVVRPRRVRTFKMMPVGHSMIAYRGVNYFYNTGLFYSHRANNYIVVPPPRGIRIRVLPVGFRAIMVAGAAAYYYQGAYYRQVGDEYEVIKPEVGTLVPALPEDNVDEVKIDGTVYYEYDNLLYKPVVTEAGTQYEVVGEIKD